MTLRLPAGILASPPKPASTERGVHTLVPTAECLSVSCAAALTQATLCARLLDPFLMALTTKSRDTQILPWDSKNQFAWWVRTCSPYHLGMSPNHRHCISIPDLIPSSSRSLTGMLMDKDEAYSH
uniref:Uncharacterized protein n=1 Tax=Opuntia streptacantha TaxID=393608 RepID=A0A7C9DAC5_OPUST